MRKKKWQPNLAPQDRVIIFTSIKVMIKLIKESIVAAIALTSIVLFMAAAVIAIYKAAGM